MLVASTSTPSERRPWTSPPIGRPRAASSASKTVGPRARAATAGTKRMTVPASPQSIVVDPVNSAAGVTIQSGP